MSKIEWTDESWNPIIGCSKVSAGCQNCYAEKMAWRLANMGVAGYQSTVNCSGKWNGIATWIFNQIDKPLHWKKPRMIFVCSMGDFWHDTVTPEMRSKVFCIVRRCKQHIFQFLTKRPENIDDWPDDLNNAWLGVTAENQEMADKRISILLDIPAAVRFVSCEPMMGYVDLYDAYDYLSTLGRPNAKPVSRGIDWVIVGAESGPNRRECKPEWIDNIVAQCATAGVPCFVKQIYENGKKVKMPSQYPQEWPETKS